MPSARRLIQALGLQSSIYEKSGYQVHALGHSSLALARRSICLLVLSLATSKLRRRSRACRHLSLFPRLLLNSIYHHNGHCRPGRYCGLVFLPSQTRTPLVQLRNTRASSVGAVACRTTHSYRSITCRTPSSLTIHSSGRAFGTPLNSGVRLAIEHI